MRKWILGLMLLTLCGCSTSPVVYENMQLIKENYIVQKELADMLLESVKIQNQEQLEAVLKQRLELQDQYDQTIGAINRLVRYFEVEEKVDVEQLEIYNQIKKYLELLQEQEGESP